MPGNDEFNDRSARFFALYERKDFAGALNVCDELEMAFPEQRIHLIYWRMCIYSITGDMQAMMAAFQNALDQGMWWSQMMLRNDPDFANIQGNPEFERLVGKCAQMEQEANQASQPERTVLKPVIDAQAHPIVFVLHGRLHLAIESADTWKAIQSLGWEVVLMQSSQLAFPGGYCWDDPDKTAREVRTHMLEVTAGREAGITEIILAGFSQGASRALSLAYQLEVPVSGVIAVAPGRIALDDLIKIIDDHPERKPKIVIMSGMQDRGHENHKGLVSALTVQGVPCRLMTVEGMGHNYPDDFGTLFNDSIDFLGA
ncbi:MAG: hypothetical protein HPY76_11280 [Anaerolineae bacterium]|nr:hypothetical protein [Anaerolineae bacterium]